MDNEQARRTILYAYRHHWKDPAYVCRFCGRVEGMPHAAQCDGVRALEHVIVLPSLAAHAERDYCESCGYTDSHDPNCPRPSPAGPDALAEEQQRMFLAQRINDVHPSQNYFSCSWHERQQIIAALRFRPAQDRDAERYRWLRSHPDAPIFEPTLRRDIAQGERLDEALDAAMSQQEKG